MLKTHQWTGGFRARAASLLLGLTAICAFGATPKRVLILNSFGRDVAPFRGVVLSFRTRLARELGESVDIYEAPLDMARSADGGFEAHFVDFIEHGYPGGGLDLVVPVGGPASRFAAQYRERLFRDTPIVFTAVDPRLLPTGALQTNATLVTQTLDLRGMMEDMLQLQPETTNIVVVFGTSPLEKFWVEESRRQWQGWTNRMNFTWFDSLSLAQVQEKTQKLPPRSFIFFGLLLMDAERVPYDNDMPLKTLHSTANAPIFGVFKSQLGFGAIGGRLYQEHQLGDQAAKVALRILQGEKVGEIAPQINGSPRPEYDWRELRRWGVKLDRLPAGSLVEFRERTVWDLYRGSILIAIAVCLGEAALLVLLVAGRRKRRRAEQALRESEERFRSLLEQAPEAVFVYDVDQDRVLVTNAQAERLMGCSRQDLVACGPQRFYTPDQPDGEPVARSFRENIERALRGDSVVFERTICNVLGHRLHCEVRLVRLPAGKRKLVRASFIDISEHKRHEAELRALAERYQAMTSATNSGFWEVDNRGKILLVNDRSCELYGYSKAELLARSLGDIEAVEGPAEIAAHLAAIMLAGQARFETKHRCKNGNVLDVEVSTTYQPSSDTFLAFHTDITARKQSESELRKNEERLRLVMDANSEGVWDWNIPSGRSVFSPSYCRMLGYEPEEFATDFSSWKKLVHSDDFERVNQAHADHFHNHKQFCVELRMRKKSGDWCWILSRGTVVERDSEGHAIRMVGTHQNITAHKLAEASLQDLTGRLIAAQEKEQTRLAKELHDGLCQSLALLAVQLEVFAQRPPAGPDQVSRLLLEFSARTKEFSGEVHRLSHGLHPAKLEQLGLAAAIAGFCREIHAGGVIVVSFTSNQVPRALPPDLTLCLYRVTQEALQNVVKHSDARRATVDLAMVGSEITLNIVDDGGGFDPGFKSGHTGLGLISMRERVRFVGGRISVESKLGEGTRVSVRVPCSKGRAV